MSEIFQLVNKKRVINALEYKDEMNVNA